MLKRETEKEKKERTYLVTKEEVQESKNKKKELSCNQCDNKYRVYPTQLELDNHINFRHK